MDHDLPRGWHECDAEPGRYDSQVTPEHDTYRRGVHLRFREVWLSVETRDETTRIIDRPMRDGESLADAIAWLERETPRHDLARSASVTHRQRHGAAPGKEPFMFDACTCGEAHPHEVMRRHTADGISVHLESDGKVLGLFGRSLAGIPVRRPRTAESQRHALKAGRLLLNSLGFYDAKELGALYADACEAARRGIEIRDVHRERKEAKPAPPPPLNWTTVRADRDGKTTERHARMPRLMWPDLAVADYCGGPGSKNGRYVLLRRDTADGRECWREVQAFRNLDALWAFVRS